MLRRLMLAALALCAFLSLESCGVDRLVAPQGADGKPAVLGKNQPVSMPVGPRERRMDLSPSKDGDGGGGSSGIDTTMRPQPSDVDSLQTATDR